MRGRGTILFLAAVIYYQSNKIVVHQYTVSIEAPTVKYRNETIMPG